VYKKSCTRWEAPRASFLEVTNGGESEGREVASRASGAAHDRAAARLLDAEEAQFLREADAMRLWQQLGYVHMREYLENEMGYRANRMAAGASPMTLEQEAREVLTAAAV
jgi:hypothetical protein